MLPLGFSMYSLNLGSDTLIFFSTYQLISGNFLICLSPLVFAIHIYDDIIYRNFYVDCTSYLYLPTSLFT